MSTELDIFQQGGAVARAARDDGFTSRVSASSTTSKRISFSRNKFVIKVNGNEVNQSNQDHLDVVVINAADVSRMYYAKGYNANDKEKSRPVCWTSNSQVPDPTVHEGSDTTPGRQSDRCVTCPQNVKGSGPNGTKACRFERRLAVVLAHRDAEGRWFLGDEIYQMKLASMSIFPTDGPRNRQAFNAYSDFLKANNEVLMGVVSRITFDTQSSVDKVGFQAVYRLTDEQFEAMKVLQATEESRRAITITVGGGSEDGEETFAPTSQAVPAQFAPAAQPAPQQVAPVENVKPQAQVDNVPEPTVRSESKPVSQAPTKVDLGDPSLDDLLGEWG